MHNIIMCCGGDCVMVMFVAAVCSGVSAEWAARQPISILRGSSVAACTCWLYMIVYHMQL